MGSTLAVWTKLKGSSIAAELNVHGARAKELNDEWLSTMPALPALVPEAPSYDVPAAYTPDKKTPTVQKHSSTHVAPIQVVSSESGAQLEYFDAENNQALYSNGKRTVKFDN